ncbi:T9SS type A sorting domain-containing protein, partial [Mangrovimonas spongiae]|uniref:T9SS type A sorting domain-containing protein n=1 Tax=Mangrovimonas spongiae TaxID=2494697 RepID=UPI0013A5E2E4
CGNDATETVRVSRMYDETDPTIADIDDYMLDGCNTAWPESLDTTWSDNCSDGGSITSDGGVDDGSDGCMQYRLYTFSVTDACGNDATETVRVSRMYDETDPTIADIDDYMLDGCNTAWPESLDTTWSDNCSDGGSITSDGGVDDGSDGCIQYRLYTFSVTDACGNDATETVRVSRMYDETDPTITCTEQIPNVCNVEFPSLTATWSDNCSDGGTLTLEGPSRIEMSEDGCSEIGYYDFEVTDDCGNSTTETCTVIREFDTVDNCETAFAKADEGAQCFIPDFNRWGWTNYLPCKGKYVMDLWAGAAHCNIDNGELVGTVIVNYTNDSVLVTYNINEGYIMSESHVFVDCDPYPIKGNGKPTVAPGQYPFNASYSGYVQNYTVEIQNPEADNHGGIYVIAHAVTCEISCICSSSMMDMYSSDNGDTTTYIDEFHCEPDVDGDLVETACDICPEGNNNYDADGDGTPDACDDTPNGDTESGLIGFTAYPVPFDYEVNIAYNFNYNTDIVIEVFDTKGALIRKVENRNYISGTKVVTTIDMSRTDNQLFFVRLRTHKGTFIKKILSSKTQP